MTSLTRLAARGLWIGAFILCAWGNGRAQDAWARASWAKAGEPWVGQRDVLVVELLAPGYFAGAPSFHLPDVPGLLILAPSESPTVGDATENGVTYSSQRHEFSVFAQRPGAFTVPSLAIGVTFKRNPLDPLAVTQTVRTAPASLTAKSPPGAEKLGALISATDLVVTDVWKPEPGVAKLGDAFTRTLAFTASNVPGMAFPAFHPAPVEGLGIYLKTPVVQDKSERGEMTGQRIEAVTYVCQRPGIFTIPALRLKWWNTRSEQLETIDLPARQIEVAPSPAAASAQPARPSVAWATEFPFWWPRVVLFMVTAALAWGRRTHLAAAFAKAIAASRPVRLAPLNPPGKARARDY